MGNILQVLQQRTGDHLDGYGAGNLTSLVASHTVGDYIYTIGAYSRAVRLVFFQSEQSIFVIFSHASCVRLRPPFRKKDLVSS